MKLLAVLFLFCFVIVAQACLSNGDCNSGEYCERDFNCDGIGVCTLTPDSCIELFSPFCGCDGTTYSNECVAHASRVSVARSGTCESPLFTSLTSYYTSDVTPLSPRSSTNNDDDDESNSLGNRIVWAGMAVVLFLAFL